MRLTNSEVTQGHGLTERTDNLISIHKDGHSIHPWLLFMKSGVSHMEIITFVKVSGYTSIYHMLYLICFSISKRAAVCSQRTAYAKGIETFANVMLYCPHLFQYSFHLRVFLQVGQINICNPGCPVQQRHPPPNHFHLHNYRAGQAQERERSSAFT